ncbi:SDR family oxidoreductase [uncultured Jatrophihabitans sp.]|uniref:SDR family oxidoreductase n=1 Tax=uncultured Jatrophihabitans sp. TaxID=1610747 RepID=UPI0035CB0D3A
MSGFDVRDAVVVVTGGAGGIGAALCRRLPADGAAQVVVVDVDLDAAQRIADEVDGVAEAVDVSDRAAVQALVGRTLERDGRIDLFCSNAGITTGVELDDDPAGLWQRAFEVNTMAHVHAASAVLPSMLERGGGWLLNTASAAGLFLSAGDAPYTVTKHAAVGFAKYLAVTYGGRGIGVSVLCPMGVDTPMLSPALAEGNYAARAVRAAGELVTAEHVADVVARDLAAGTFLVLPHPEVKRFLAYQAADPDGWLTSTRALYDGIRT